MASVHRVDRTLKDGTTSKRWRVRWRDPDGQPRSENYNRSEAAKERKRQIERQLDTGIYVDPRDGKTLLNDYIDDWWGTKVALKPKTQDSYEGILRRKIQPIFGNQPLNRIDSRDIERWLADMHTNGDSTSVIRQSYNLLHQILQHATRHRIIARNPAQDIKPPGTQPKRIPRAITQAQLDRLIDTVPDRYQALIATLGYTGLRWAEAIGLQRRHINMLRKQLHIESTLSEVNGHFHRVAPKTNEERIVLLPGFLVDMLAAHMLEYVDGDDDALLFTLKEGQPIRGPNFRRRVWLPACEQVGVECTIHELRHTAASLMIDRDWPIVSVSKTLGHSSIAITVDRYGHMYRDTQEALVARFDDAREAR
jgi:integrase